MLPIFEYSILNCSEAVFDAIWAILKYKEINISRKISSISEILGIDKSDIIEYAVVTENGRVLDKETRHVIHSLLIKRTKINNTAHENARN